MAKIGYIYNKATADGLEADREWMKQFGCCEIVDEEEHQEVLRPQWKQMLPKLQEGDVLVVSKLSNAVRGSRELAVLLDFCRIRAIRLVSVRDRIDSAGELFAETRVSDVLNTIALLPAEVRVLRTTSVRSFRMKSRQKTAASKTAAKQERNKRVINMYKNHYSIDAIWRVSGFRSRSSVFRVLRDAGIQPHSKRRNEGLESEEE